MKQQNEITKIFSNELFGEIRTVKLEDEFYFVASDVAKVLGYKRPGDAVIQHCKHSVKHRIVDNTGFEQQMNVIPEGDLYRLTIKSKLPQAEAFEEWIMDEVLPSLRRDNFYIGENADSEEVKLDLKYGSNKIKEHFKTVPLESLEKEFENLKAYHSKKTGSERIKDYNKLIDTLKDRRALYDPTKQYGYIGILDNFINDTLYPELLILQSRSKAGRIGAKTKVINKLQLENESLKEDQYEPDWHLLDKHGYSVNSMYEVVRCKPGYNYWRNSLDFSQCGELNVDINKPLRLYLHIGKAPGYDTDNLIKSVQDAIAQHYNFGTDYKIDELIISSERVPSVSDGFVYFDVINIDKSYGDDDDR